jgi:hypothetical protein
MSQEKTIVTCTLIGIILLCLVILFREVFKYIKNGYRTEDEIGIEKMMDKEIEKAFPNVKMKRNTEANKIV